MCLNNIAFPIDTTRDFFPSIFVTSYCNVAECIQKTVKMHVSYLHIYSILESMYIFYLQEVNDRLFLISISILILVNFLYTISSPDTASSIVSILLSFSFNIYSLIIYKLKILMLYFIYLKISSTYAILENPAFRVNHLLNNFDIFLKEYLETNELLDL